MSKPGDAPSDVSDDAIEKALSDHHLDEVAEMIEQSQTQNTSRETSFSEPPVGSNHSS